jgi:hypothetical protein
MSHTQVRAIQRRGLTATALAAIALAIISSADIPTEESDRVDRALRPNRPSERVPHIKVSTNGESVEFGAVFGPGENLVRRAAEALEAAGIPILDSEIIGTWADSGGVGKRARYRVVIR